ncbi:TPA: hypothetical protein ACKTEE_001630 [Streptococcus pyogenes]|uniref:hypothetical protein n=1 Tax=Streptococcus pyogenes TaxID=1314 RepID=UPI002B1BC59C|nr:hypothetical protein [Streptococcus pyogenes]HEQ6376011.1 hypothetical protein [Streptococcus pyogenes]HEQ7984766.1 hypothetical protein [Streptococcus pyogenes]HEQ8593482.1 hypothetical protein [Streptococcus pyogenes]HER2678916.1 hypothetical protein [Streptococcus pyogenes]
MKKTLTLLLALFAIGVTSSVRAEDITFKQVPGQQTIQGVTVKSFKVGDKSINVSLEAFGYISTYINGNKIKVPNVKHKLQCPTKEQANYYPDCYDREWETSGERADQYGNYTVQLQKPLAVEDVVTLSFADDGHFYLGKLVFEDEKTQNTRLQAEKAQEQEEAKKRDNELRKQLEENMLKQIREEDHKPWHQRLSESIQDQWWNFKGLFQ